MTFEDRISEARLSQSSSADLSALLVDRSSSALTPEAHRLTLNGWGRAVTYSRKVFIPLTHLCRDVCHYCTFAKAPRDMRAPYLTIEEVVDIARAGAAAGCKEALFTLGDKPEMRYRSARAWLDTQGYASTLDYLADAAQAVIDQTGLLPHLNPGVMSLAEASALRHVSASMGAMLESCSDRLCERGQPHFGSPDKAPAVRLQFLADLGRASIPTTTGLLIGIGETRAERIASLVAIRDLHRAYGHIQEVIIQNFRAKVGTRMATAPEPDEEEHCWTIAAARLILGAGMSIQAPPNLCGGTLNALMDAGINDWGGISPVTIDHVNPEAPWPHLDELAERTAAHGRRLVERLAILPGYAANLDKWAAPAVRRHILHAMDGGGLAREDDWQSGLSKTVPGNASARVMSDTVGGDIRAILERALDDKGLELADIVTLFGARGADFDAVVACADRLRARQAGETITYVVNRNINYTNICLYRCSFCAFSKGGGNRALRGPAYDLDLDEIARRAADAANLGATEVCLQGGIHPRFTGQTYLDILKAARDAAPTIHIHAFSPLEVSHGASTLGLALPDYFALLKSAGLSTLPGTAAEILDDEIRDVICPDKLRTDEWLEVLRNAHAAGLKTTSTIMFGHVEHYRHWARHLLLLRDLQLETGGITEFVPLGFVHSESPMGRKGLSRPGPTLREAILMHAVGRIVLGSVIPNIQTSWVKMGPEGARLCLAAGANDLGGVLMDESITRAAGGAHGQMMDVVGMMRIAHAAGRPVAQRSTCYDRISRDAWSGAEGSASSPHVRELVG
nr:5-amino-6-(D-ribitylamino)uracil--L-tyrosine 4-hydroxyphenyl transferase CofH [Sphingomonas sp. CDS-1]